MQAARVSALSILAMAGVALAAWAGGCIGSPGNNGNGSPDGGGANTGASGQTAGDSRTADQGRAAPPAGRISDASRRFPLDGLATAAVEINGNKFRVWLARSSAETQEGLMHVPPTEIEDDQGMLFVFDDDDLRGFWMKNTITSLDIAFIRSDGQIVKIHTMPILTLRTFPSDRPARFALEVKAGTFGRLGIREGDHVEIPDAVSNTSP